MAAILTVQGPLGIITLTQAKKGNPFSTAACLCIADLLRVASRNDVIVATIIQSQGGVFSSGGQLEDILQDPHGFIDACDELCQAILSHPKVLAVALQGPVYGHTASLIGLFDFVYAHESSCMSLVIPPVHLGFAGGHCASAWGLPKRLPRTSIDKLVRGQVVQANDLATAGLYGRILDTLHEKDFRLEVQADMLRQGGGWEMGRLGRVRRFAWKLAADCQARLRDDLEALYHEAQLPHIHKALKDLGRALKSKKSRQAKL